MESRLAENVPLVQTVAVVQLTVNTSPDTVGMASTDAVSRITITLNAKTETTTGHR